MKPAIIILSAIGLLGTIVGIILFISGGVAIAAQCQSVTGDQVALQQCLNANASAGAGQVLGGILLLVLGGLCTFVGWILGLVKTIQLKAWGWFVLVLLISPLGSLIYGLFGPFEAAQPAMAGASMYQSPYQPPYQQ